MLSRVVNRAREATSWFMSAEILSPAASNLELSLMSPIAPDSGAPMNLQPLLLAPADIKSVLRTMALASPSHHIMIDGHELRKQQDVQRFAWLGIWSAALIEFYLSRDKNEGRGVTAAAVARRVANEAIFEPEEVNDSLARNDISIARASTNLDNTRFLIGAKPREIRKRLEEMTTEELRQTSPPDLFCVLPPAMLDLLRRLGIVKQQLNVPTIAFTEHVLAMPLRKPKAKGAQTARAAVAPNSLERDDTGATAATTDRPALAPEHGDMWATLESVAAAVEEISQTQRDHFDATLHGVGVGEETLAYARQTNAILGSFTSAWAAGEEGARQRRERARNEAERARNEEDAEQEREDTFRKQVMTGIDGILAQAAEAPARRAAAQVQTPTPMPTQALAGRGAAPASRPMGRGASRGAGRGLVGGSRGSRKPAAPSSRVASARPATGTTRAGTTQAGAGRHPPSAVPSFRPTASRTARSTTASPSPPMPKPPTPIKHDGRRRSARARAAAQASTAIWATNMTTTIGEDEVGSPLLTEPVVPNDWSA